MGDSEEATIRTELGLPGLESTIGKCRAIGPINYCHPTANYYEDANEEESEQTIDFACLVLHSPLDPRLDVPVLPSADE